MRLPERLLVALMATTSACLLLVERRQQKRQTRTLVEERHHRRVAECRVQDLHGIGQMAAGMSHEFNNLLAVIMGNAEFLASTSSDAGVRARANHILTSALRGSNILQQLLSFAGRQMVRNAYHDANSLVGDCMPSIQSCLNQSITLSVHYQPTPVICWCDRNEFERAMLNIVTNAVQAMPHGGLLIIRISQQDRHVRVTVRDTGTGMPPQVLEHVFEPFFTTRDLTRTGLGLSQVYGFATQSGGKVAIDSAVGRGTEVVINLPMRPVETKPNTLLVVDDEADLLDVISTLLQSDGEYTVLCCDDPLQALHLAETRQIDLLLTDIVMPAMSGNELAQRMLSLHPTIKILMMTGYSHQAGSYPLLRKPFRLTELRHRIDEMMKPGRWC